MHRPVHPSFGRVKYGWMGKKMKEQSLKIIHIVSYALEISVNGVTCVLVVHFRSKNTFQVF